MLKHSQVSILIQLATSDIKYKNACLKVIFTNIDVKNMPMSTYNRFSPNEMESVVCPPKYSGPTIIRQLRVLKLNLMISMQHVLQIIN